MKTALVYIFGTALACQMLFVAGIATGNITVDWNSEQLDVSKMSHEERVQLAAQLTMGRGE